MSGTLAGVDRALQVIETLAQTGAAGAQLRDLATELSLDKAVLHRILSTLKDRNFAEQDPETGAYRLGSTLLAIADDYMSQDTLRLILHRIAVTVSGHSNELCHVGVPEGSVVRYIDKIEPERPMRVWSRIGIRNPMATTALGRALLSINTDSTTDLQHHIGSEGIDIARVWDAVSRAKELGYATELEENEPGICCVAVAIERAGIPLAAVSITAPSTRMSPARVEELGGLLRTTVAAGIPQGIRIQQLTLSPTR